MRMHPVMEAMLWGMAIGAMLVLVMWRG